MEDLPKMSASISAGIDDDDSSPLPYISLFYDPNLIFKTFAS